LNLAAINLLCTQVVTTSRSKTKSIRKRFVFSTSIRPGVRHFGFLDMFGEHHGLGSATSRRGWTGRLVTRLGLCDMMSPPLNSTFAFFPILRLLCTLITVLGLATASPLCPLTATGTLLRHRKSGKEEKDCMDDSTKDTPFSFSTLLYSSFHLLP